MMVNIKNINYDTRRKTIITPRFCARLSYGVKLLHIPSGEVTVLEMMNCDAIDGDIHDMINNFQPYLRPMSSMTEEEMDRLFDILHIDKDGKDDDWIKINDVYGIKFFFPTGRWVENVAEAYDYLNAIHIDYRGLIPKGLLLKLMKVIILVTMKLLTKHNETQV